MKLNFSLAIFMLISGLTVSAQTRENSNLTRDSFESLVSADEISTIVYNNRYEGIRGTPFLFDDWILGELVLTDNHFNEVEIKYDMMEDNVLIMNSSGIAIYPNKSIVKSFHFSNSEGEYRNFINLALVDYTLGPDGNSGFVELLYEGKNSLIAKKLKFLKRVEARGAYSENRTYDEFRYSPAEYYWINNEVEVTLLKGGKKNVLKALNDNGDLASYVKNTGLNLKKENDLILLMIYFDTIYQK